MRNPKTSAIETLCLRLEKLAHQLPHRPASQRAHKFRQLTPGIHKILDHSSADEAMKVLVKATYAVAAIINTGHLDAHGHSDLSHAYRRLMQRNVTRCVPFGQSDFIDHIAQTLRTDKCGFIPLITPILPYLLPSQLKQLDQALKQPPVPASDPYHGFARVTRRDMRRTIAFLLGDSTRYFEINAQCGTDDPVMTSRVLLAAGNPQEAMRTLNTAMLGRRASPQTDRLRADILAKEGATDMAQDVRLSCFRRYLCADALRDYLKQVPDFDDIQAEYDALAFAADFPDPCASVRFFLRYDRPALAADRILSEPDAWATVDHWGQDDAAEELAPHHPLAASILLRGRTTQIMREDAKELFHEARSHLKVLRSLARQAEADNRRPGGYEQHAIWFANLRDRMPECRFFLKKTDLCDAA
jgi:hypothetical protein